MIPYIGDFKANATVRYAWATNGSNGASITRATNGSIRIYKGTSTTERTSSNGITDTEDFDSLTGLHVLSIDLSDNTDAGFYSTGSDFFVVLQGAVIDGQTVNCPLFAFSIENRAPRADVVQISGSAVSTTTAQLGVNVVQVSGDATAADNLEAAADGTGYNLGGGSVVAASVTGAVGSVTGNVGGNVVGSVASVTGAVGSVTGNVGGSVASVTGNVGGNVVGSVGSVTGAVGSVTGNVGGNVVGSVGSVSNSNSIVQNLLTWDPTTEAGTPGSVADILVDTKADTAAILVDTGTSGVVVASINNGAVTAAAIATDAIDADAIAASAVTEIAAGISVPTAAAIADAVWDEPTSGHQADGTTGKALTDAAAGGGGGTSVYANAPYTLRANGQFPSGVVDIVVGTILTLDLYITDRDGVPLSLAGSPTITVGVRNATSGATVGSDQSATIEFARGGICSVDTVSAWSATAGTYRISASIDYGTDVVVAGPLEMIVRSR